MGSMRAVYVTLSARITSSNLIAPEEGSPVPVSPALERQFIETTGRGETGLSLIIVHFDEVFFVEMSALSLTHGLFETSWHCSISFC